jgi:hypothetical protein
MNQAFSVFLAALAILHCMSLIQAQTTGEPFIFVELNQNQFIS